MMTHQPRSEHLMLAVALVVSLCAWSTNSQTLAQTTQQQQAQRPSNSASTNGRRLALLVGCTTYPNLRPGKQLQGPQNDVRLLRKVLMAKPYDFPAQNIRCLSEDPLDHGLPTLENIRSGFAWLVEASQPGDQIVVLLAGHGSRQPANADPQGDDPEPDGKDEVFLPRDIGKWLPQNQCIENALVDDEIYQFALRVIAKQADLWILLDSCHSGAGIRGTDEIVAREVPSSELGIPTEANDTTVANKIAVARGNHAEPPFDLRAQRGETTGNLIAFYAAQSDELEYDVPLPPDAPDAPKYGLLAYTVCQFLQQRRSTPLTYAELGRAIYPQYQAWSRSYPTPFVDGKNLKAPVLGQMAGFQFEIQLERLSTGDYRINAGQLQSMTAGSQLAVYAPGADPKQEKPLGHVQVVSTSIDGSDVRPCAYGDVARNNILPDGGPCLVVSQNLGDARLRLAVDQNSAWSKDEVQALLKTVETDLRLMAEDTRTPFRIVDSLAVAHWVVQWRQRELKLIQADIALLEQDAELPRGATVIALSAEQPVETIQRELGRIFRAQSLMALTGQMQESSRADAGVPLKLEMFKYKDKQDAKGTPIEEIGRGIQLQADEFVGWRVTNENLMPVDVTLLYIASDWSIASLFPHPESVGVNVRIAPGQPHTTRPFRVTTSTVGREHLVAIAMEGVGPQRDFRFLAEPSLMTAQKQELATRGPAGDVFKTPLGQLLKSAMYREGDSKDLIIRGGEESGRFGMVSISWDVLTREP